MIEFKYLKTSTSTIITSWRTRAKNSKRSLNDCCNTIYCSNSRWLLYFCTNFNRFFSHFHHLFLLFFFLVLNNVVTHLNDLVLRSSRLRISNDSTWFSFWKTQIFHVYKTVYSPHESVFDWCQNRDNELLFIYLYQIITLFRFHNLCKNYWIFIKRVLNLQ
jgi:hypothetical protein